MQIKQARLSFIQVECLADPLRSLQAPSIPFPFLLSGPLFEGEYASAKARIWKRHYGSLFWHFYVQKLEPTTKDLWRTQVPLMHKVNVPLSTDWPQVQMPIPIMPVLYPWGTALVVDMLLDGSFTLDEAVALAQEVRHSQGFQMGSPGTGAASTLKGVFEAVMNQIHNDAFGAKMPRGDVSEIFSIVSVLDAQGVNPTEAVVEGGDIHRALDAMTGWNPLWKSIKLDPLASTTIAIRRAPPGHILYGGRRGRVVWFPGSFHSTSNTDTLRCFHQNLTAASLQAESLCRIVVDAANALAVGRSLADFSVTYRECVQLAAGILGRLYGGSFDTYRSQSVRDQIQRMYKAPVTSIRTQLGMSPLVP